jgi:hypothetical protein
MTSLRGLVGIHRWSFAVGPTLDHIKLSPQGNSPFECCQLSRSLISSNDAVAKIIKSI